MGIIRVVRKERFEMELFEMLKMKYPAAEMQDLGRECDPVYKVGWGMPWMNSEELKKLLDTWEVREIFQALVSHENFMICDLKADYGRDLISGAEMVERLEERFYIATQNLYIFATALIPEFQSVEFDRQQGRRQKVLDSFRDVVQLVEEDRAREAKREERRKAKTE